MGRVQIVPKISNQRHADYSGDVVMVVMQLEDTATGKSFDWRWLGIITESKRSSLKVIRFGVSGGEAINTITKRPRDEHLLSLHDEKLEVHVLDEESWPDGVHAFRMQLILVGRLNDVID